MLSQTITQSTNQQNTQSTNQQNTHSANILRNNFTLGTGEICDYLDVDDAQQFAKLSICIELYMKTLTSTGYELTYSFELHREDDPYKRFFITIEDAYLYKVNQFMHTAKQNTNSELFMKGRYCDEKNIAHTARYMKYQLYRNAVRQLIIIYGDKEKNIDIYANNTINRYISDQDYIAKLRGTLVGLLPVELS